MTETVETALLSFMQGLRSGRHRLAALALLGWLLSAQVLLIVHRIDHTSTGANVGCALCLAADHQTGPSTVPEYPIVRSTPERIATFAAGLPAVVLIFSYRSRAPPDYSHNR